MTLIDIDLGLIGNKFLSIAHTGKIKDQKLETRPFCTFLFDSNPKDTTIIYFFRAKARNSQRDGPMTVDSNQDGRPNYYPNSFMGPADSPKWKEAPIQVPFSDRNQRTIQNLKIDYKPHEN